ncbi:TIR domain-containing protein [Niabella hibiscisoli]|uniref:TIR domain-containing protein n=1 Tax=Niabella hibiscisoli TaxID=1825928 RepID=UPI00293E1105|nr:TIR domain-containing protein [Niabella hibiscisoli]
MKNEISLAKLSIQVSALRQAMEVVINGTTPDHAKWTGVNNFTRKYSQLALLYEKLTGDNSLPIYDTEKLPNPYDQLWPQLKSLFDLIFTDTLTLQGLLSLTETPSHGPLFNLFVSGDSEEWNGEPFEIELPRCIREYTDPELTRKFGAFDPASISELKRLPSIFAYEASCKQSPKFGYVRDIKVRRDKVKVEYDIRTIEEFLTFEKLNEMSFDLDIGKLELNRTHWALKDVNLLKELHAKGIKIPSNMRDIVNAVDVSNHVFDVALSFPGESRPLVEEIVTELERSLGPNRYFYDNNYVSQLAQPSLDILLQGIYKRAKLDVVFLSSDYQKKDWCGIEFRAIREIIMERENNRVMFIRTDDGAVDGVFKTDGYVDARKFSPDKIAGFIQERVNLIAI